MLNCPLLLLPVLAAAALGAVVQQAVWSDGILQLRVAGEHPWSLARLEHVESARVWWALGTGPTWAVDAMTSSETNATWALQFCTATYEDCVWEYLQTAPAVESYVVCRPVPCPLPEPVDPIGQVYVMTDTKTICWDPASSVAASRVLVIGLNNNTEIRHLQYSNRPEGEGALCRPLRRPAGNVTSWRVYWPA